MYSKDADPNNIMKDEWTFDIVRFLGTEGMANQQAGRKPGRGSKRLSQVEAETGLMYRSDTKLRVKVGSTVFAIVKVFKVEGYATKCLVLYPWIPRLKSSFKVKFLRNFS